MQWIANPQNRRFESYSVLQKRIMYIVKWKNKNGGLDEREFDNLGPAMEWAKTIAVFVTITGGEHSIVGMFGADSVKDGVLPDGHEYTWKKRRQQ